MGKHELRLLTFALRFPGWHTMNDSDQRARRAMYSLRDKGLLNIITYVPENRAQPQFQVRLGSGEHYQACRLFNLSGNSVY